MDGPQRPKLVESSADHPGIRRIICLMTLNYRVISRNTEDLGPNEVPSERDIVCLPLHAFTQVNS